jgi:pyruvate dehydrogenase E2 component (dihydrolipoamide acetyltransferase)
MGELLMPSLGADMEAGTVIEWLVKPGDVVHRGDIVAVVDTDKADIDIETFQGGTVGELLVPVGLRVPVGTPLATLLTAGEAPALPAAGPPPTPPVTPPVVPTAPPPPPSPPPPPRAQPSTPHVGEVRSPLLRRLARHLGVDIDELDGSGPGGAVTRHDIETAAEQRIATVPVPVEAPGASITVSETRLDDRQLAMRRAIANLMARSAREIPHYHLTTQIDMSSSLSWLEQTNLERSVHDRILPAAVLLKAVATAASRFPDLNGYWIDDAFQHAGGVHLGVAVSLRGGGLVAPAIHDADTMDLVTLMGALRDLVARTRAGHLRSSEMADPTLTVTNLGERGVEVVHGLIYPPQVALVGFGTIVERPWAAKGMIGARPIVTATLAADHRASDGMRGARFLATIDQLLQEPATL